MQPRQVIVMALASPSRMPWAQSLYYCMQRAGWQEGSEEEGLGPCGRVNAHRVDDSSGKLSIKGRRPHKKDSIRKAIRVPTRLQHEAFADKIGKVVEKMERDELDFFRISVVLE